jgi:ABC-type dipeptide/oligopeptide/nickel transport system permease subunit
LSGADLIAEAPAHRGVRIRRRGPWLHALARFRRRPLGLAALLVVLAYAIVAVFAPAIAPYSEYQIFFQYINDPLTPSLHGGHLLGTDVLGHDMLTWLLWSIRETVLVALEASLVAGLIGVFLGALAGYLGGALDAAVGWLTGAFVTVPALVIYLVVAIHYNPVPMWALPVTLGLCLWTYVAQAVRASLRTLRAREFVEAARAAGASAPRIVFRHLLPNAAGTVIIAATGVFGQSILIVATADFFGFAIGQFDRPTLGGLIANVAKVDQVVPGYVPPWWLWVIPIVSLGLLLVCANVTADTLAEVLDPTGSR